MTGEMLKALSVPAYRTTLGAVRDFSSRIAALPPDQRGDENPAAERFFPAMLRQFGHTEEDAQRWNTMMVELSGSWCSKIRSITWLDPLRSGDRNKFYA